MANIITRALNQWRATVSFHKFFRKFKYLLAPSGTDHLRSHDTEQRHKIRITLMLIYVFTASLYFGWRLTVFNPDAQIYSGAFFAAELFSFVICFLMGFTGWRRRHRPFAHTPEMGLSVDVFVTAYNEPASVIRRTVLAAIRMDYPHETWLLDDGRRPEIKSIAKELGCRYLARSNNVGAKAGNLNNALKYAKSDFIAVFDADHVAQRNFLTRLLGYFVDKQVSLVQTPQDFFNTDAFQYFPGKQKELIWHDMSEFHYVGQPGRDHWNAVTFCGSSAILRRSAIDEIGGFPEETVTEDMHASIRMQKLGYTHIYHAEPLAFGIAPVGFGEYLRQRIRWGEGNMQVCRAEGIPFSKGLKWPQRFCYGALSWLYWAAWQRIIFYLAPVVLLFVQIAPIRSDFSTFAAFFLPYILLSYLVFEEVTRGYGRFFKSEQSGMAQLLAGLIATTAVFRKNIYFRVASKELTSQSPIFLLMPQFVLLLLSVSGIAYVSFRYFIGPPLGMDPWIAGLGVFFAAVNIMTALLVIQNAFRVASKTDREFLHPIHLPIRLSDKRGSSLFGEIRKISVDEIVCEFPSDVDLLVGYEGSAEIFLPDCSVKCETEITQFDIRQTGSKRYRARLRFKEVAERDVLDQMLHAGRWYRSIAGLRECVRTPYDCLYDLFVDGSLRRPEPIKWGPALLRSSEEGKAYSTLCYVSFGHEKTIQNPMVIGFKPLCRGSKILVDVFKNHALVGQTFEIGAQISGLLPGEEALGGMGAKIYLVQLISDESAWDIENEVRSSDVRELAVNEAVL